MTGHDREFQVYTDQEQCDLFEAPYFAPAGEVPKLVVAASTLLGSKD